MTLRRDFAVQALHLFALSGFALAQPLFEQLGNNPEFFVARRSQPLDVVLLALALTLALPALLVLLEWCLHRVSARLQRLVHLGFIALLATAAALPALRPLGAGGVVQIAAGLGAGTAAALVYARFAPVRAFLTVLSAAPFVFAGLFLLRAPLPQLVQKPLAAAPITIGKPAPVVLVIFDEFSGIALMDERHEIDPIRYPNFAALAREATWFRNATSVSWRTEVAVPVILSGRLPDRVLLPVEADYPDNLFTLLGRTYALNVHETVTRLCPPSLCGSEGAESLVERMESLATDLAIVYLHVLLPEDLAVGLPPVTNQLGGFGDAQGSESAEAKGDGVATELRRLAKWYKLDRTGLFAKFVDSIEDSERPTLHFTHILLPHSGLQYSPSGKAYNRGGAPAVAKGLTPENRWKNDTWLVTQAYQRYLLQTGCADSLLGQLMDRLKAEGLYDRSLIVIVSDHGMTHVPGEHRRRVGPKGYPELLSVPLLIKAPYQREGVINDANVEIVDVLPTILDLLDTPLPWPVDGQSAVDPTLSPRSRKILFGKTVESEFYEFDAALEEKNDALARKLAIFGSGRTHPDGLYRIGAHANLVGARVPRRIRTVEGLRARLTRPKRSVAFNPNGRTAPTQIVGRIEGAGRTPLYLAVAVNRRIAAVTRTFISGGTRFEAMVPESAFRPGRNEIDVLLVSDDGKLEGRLAVKS